MIPIVSTFNVRSALRTLLREPLFASTVIATLVIGTASAASVFSVIHGVLLRPLPYRDPRSIVSVMEVKVDGRSTPATVASANLARLRDAKTFASVSGFNYSEFVVSGEADAERVIGARVDGRILDVLGVRPSRGRAIASEEAGPNPARVVVISDRLWRRRFAADTAIIGRSLILDGAPYTIVGVMSAGFEFPRNPSMARDVDVWVPRRPSPAVMMRRGIRDLFVVARLRPGATLRDAQGELDAIGVQAARDDAGLNAGWAFRTTELRDTIVGPVRPMLLTLGACVAVLVIIATLNASAASLARISRRRQNLSVRLALGATRSDIIRSVFAEAVVLAAVSSVIALPISVGVRSLLVKFAPVAVPRQEHIALDRWSVLFTIFVAGCCAITAAAGPVVWTRRLDITGILTDSNRTTTGSRQRRRFLGGFVIAQVALATLLLAITIRLYSSTRHLNEVNPGFRAKGVTTATIAMGGMRYQMPRARAMLTSQLLSRVRALPGVEKASVSTLAPLSGGLMSGGFAVVGIPGDSSQSTALRAVSSGFFETLDIAIRRGRAIEETDTEASARVVVVNRAFERQVMQGGSILDASIVLTPPGSDSAETFRVVGVADDARERDLTGPTTPIVYLSDQQASFPHSVLLVRSTVFPNKGIRTALHELDPSLALDDVQSLETRVRATYAVQVFLLLILAVFAVGGTTLIAVGVYGSVSFSLASQLRSIAIRIALGATPTRTLLDVLRAVGIQAFSGTIIGAFIALFLPRLIGTSSPVRDVDPSSALIGSVVIIGVILCAVSIPAVRARALDPVALLREDN